jgi:hypothetical protein
MMINLSAPDSLIQIIGSMTATLVLSQQWNHGHHSICSIKLFKEKRLKIQNKITAWVSIYLLFTDKRKFLSVQFLIQRLRLLCSNNRIICTCHTHTHTRTHTHELCVCYHCEKNSISRNIAVSIYRYLCRLVEVLTIFQKLCSPHCLIPLM